MLSYHLMQLQSPPNSTPDPAKPSAKPVQPAKCCADHRNPPGVGEAPMAPMGVADDRHPAGRGKGAFWWASRGTGSTCRRLTTT
jgi:hypothetical protein